MCPLSQTEGHDGSVLVQAGERLKLVRRCMSSRTTFSARLASPASCPSSTRQGTGPERRAQFMREGVHYEGEYALVVQFTPPLRRKSKVADLIYDDDPPENTSPASRILEQFKKAIADLEDGKRPASAATFPVLR